MDRKNLQNYWNQRFEVYGHTGWKIPLIYRYDQKIRVNAFKKLLFRKNISLIDKNVLDIGCGTGDFIYAISKLGANVTGCDISNKLSAKTSRRFSKCDNIKIYSCAAKDFNLEKKHFDLITSITVLQHIIPEKELIITLNNLYDLLKPSGYLLLCESVIPDGKEKNRKTNYYTNVKTRSEWIDVVEKSGFSLVLEESYPQYALKFLETFMEISKTSDNKVDALKSGVKLSSVQSFLLKVVLAFFTPIDKLLAVPLPKKYSSQMFYLFRKM